MSVIESRIINHDFRICITCKKPILPPYSNGRQRTHPGACRKAFHDKLRREYHYTHERKAYVPTPMKVAEKVSRSLARSGFNVDLSNDPDPKRTAKLIRLGKKAEVRLEAHRERRAEEAEAERIAAIPVSRSCIGDGDGPHDLLNYHTYLDKDGIEWTPVWTLNYSLDKTRTVFCSMFRTADPYSDPVARLFPYEDELELSCDAFGDVEARPLISGGWFMCDLGDPDQIKAVPDSFDVESFLKYRDWIIPWVQETVTEYKMKGFEQEYHRSKWSWWARQHMKFTPYLQTHSVRLRRNKVCHGLRNEMCEGTDCHLVLTQELLAEKDWQAKYRDDPYAFVL